MAAKKPRSAKQKAATKRMLAANKARRAALKKGAANRGKVKPSLSKKSPAKKTVRKTTAKKTVRKSPTKSVSKQRGYATVRKSKASAKRRTSKKTNYMQVVKDGAIAIGAGALGATSINAAVSNVPLPASMENLRSGYKGSLIRIIAGVVAGVGLEMAGMSAGRHVAYGTATVETTKYAEKMISEKMPSVKLEGLGGYAGAKLTADEVAMIESLDLDDDIAFQGAGNVLSFAGVGSYYDNVKIYS